MKQKFIQKYDLFFFITILVMILFLVWSAQAQNKINEGDCFYSNANTLALE